jgi:hypothetical protein
MRAIPLPPGEIRKKTTFESGPTAEIPIKSVTYKSSADALLTPWQRNFDSFLTPSSL